MRSGFIAVLAVSLGACAAPGPSPLEGLPVFTEPAHQSVSAPDGFDTVWWLTRANADFSEATIHEVESGVVRAAPYATGGYDVAPGHWRGGVLFTSTRGDNWNLWFAAPDGAVTPLPAPVNSDASDCCSVPLPNGNFLFSSDRAGDWSIYEGVAAGDGFEVRPLTGEVNSAHGEWPSYVSPDGNLLLFSSIRPGGRGGDDIYVSQLGREGWSAPCLLPAPVNTDGYEDSASLVGDRLVWSTRLRPVDGVPTFSSVQTIAAGPILAACGAEMRR